jgi:putative riboflavin transport system substrate-binding protein
MDRTPLRMLRRAAAAALSVGFVLGTGLGVMAQSPEPTPEPTSLVVGLGYVPNVQFAQFYLAEQAGYYEQAGLDVTFQNKIDPELITLLAQGAVDVGMADGTSVIPAVSQGIPVVYAATIYGRDPNVVFALSDTGLKTAADLAGMSVGIPGRYGSSWVALQAILRAAGLTTDDIEVVTLGFGQLVAVSTGQVDAATGFVNNEPVQLALQGLDVDVLETADIAPLPGPGLVVGTDTLASKGDALRAFTAATLRAMEDIIADPQVGLDATFDRVPELASDPETQLAILEATIESWTSDYAGEHGLGSIDWDVWASGLEVMRALPDSVVSDTLTVEDLVTEELQP